MLDPGALGDNDFMSDRASARTRKHLFRPPAERLPALAGLPLKFFAGDLPCGQWWPVPELPRHFIREHRFERELRALIADAREADAFVEACRVCAGPRAHSGLQLAGGSCR